MIKKWLGLYDLEKRILLLESKPQSYADLGNKLRVTMNDGVKKHTFTAYRKNGRFAKKPK